MATWMDGPEAAGFFRVTRWVINALAWRERLGFAGGEEGGTSFTYVTDGIESAIQQARAAANGKDVAIAGGGRLLRQVLKAGLLDQLELHIAPVVLGDGMRLLDPDLGLGDKEAIELTPTRVVDTPDVTHIRYTVNGRAPLVLDDRGRGEPAAAV